MSEKLNQAIIPPQSIVISDRNYLLQKFRGTSSSTMIVFCIDMYDLYTAQVSAGLAITT